MMTWRKRVMAYVLSAAMLISSTPMNAFGMEILSDDSEEILVQNEGADDLLVIDDDGEEVLALEEGLDFEEAEDDLIIEDLIEDEDPWMGEGVAGELIDPMETEMETEAEMPAVETEVETEAEMPAVETEAETEAEMPAVETEVETEEELLLFEELVEEAGQNLADDGEQPDAGENQEHDYSVWFENVRDEYGNFWIYDNEIMNLTVNTNNLADVDYDVEWQVGVWDESLNDGQGEINTDISVPYEISEDKTYITLSGASFNEEVSGVNVRAIIKVTDEENNGETVEISRADTYAYVVESEYQYEYPYTEPGDDFFLPGNEVHVGKSMNCWVRDGKHLEGEKVNVAFTSISHQWQVWDENAEPDEHGNRWVNSNENSSLVLEDRGDHWSFYSEEHGRLEITLMYDRVEGDEGDNSFTFHVYFNGDTFELNKYYPDKVEYILTGHTAEIKTGLYHRWNHGENAGESRRNDYRLEVEGFDPNRIENAWVDEDGQTLYVTAKNAKEIEGYTSIGVQIWLPDENGEYYHETTRNVWVDIKEGYYFIYHSEFGRMRIGDVLTMEPELKFRYRDENGTVQTDTIPEEEVLFGVTDIEGWEPVEGDDYSLIRVGKDGVGFTMTAKINQAAAGEKENWKEAARLRIEYSGLDTAIYTEWAYGQEEDGGVLFTDTPQVITVDTANLEDAFADYGHMDWIVNWDGQDECDSCITYDVSNDTKTLTLTANGCHAYRDVRVVALAKAVDAEAGYNLGGKEMKFHILENELNCELPQGDHGMLRYWDLEINKFQDCYVKNAAYPYGKDLQMEITDVRMEIADDAEDGCFELYHWEGGNGWSVHANNWGNAYVTVDYVLSDGSTGTRTFNVWVGGCFYDMDFETGTGTDQVLPGAVAEVTANVWGDCYDNEQGHYDADMTGLRVEWFVKEGHDALAGIPDDTGVRDFVDGTEGETLALKLKDNTNGVEEIRLEAIAYMPNGEGKDEICRKEFIWNIRYGYHQLAGVDYLADGTAVFAPLGMRGNIKLKDSRTINPGYWYFDGENPNGILVEDVRFRWEWDPNLVEIKDANDNILYQNEEGSLDTGDAPFTLTRIGDWDGHIKLIVESTEEDENGNHEELNRDQWYLGRLETGLKFDWSYGNPEDNGVIFSDVEEPFIITLDNSQIARSFKEGYEVIWKVYGEEITAGTTEFENVTAELGTDANGNDTLTLNVNVSEENDHVGEWANVSVAVVMNNDGTPEVLSERETNFEIVRHENHFNEFGDENWILKGWHFDISRENSGWTRDMGRPYGGDVDYRIHNLELVEWMEDSQEGCLRVEEWEDGNGWSIIADHYGYAKFRIEYQIHGEEHNREHEFLVGAGDQRYDMEIYSDTEDDRILPGNSMTLTAQVEGYAFDEERGEYKVDPDNLRVVWTCTEGKELLAAPFEDAEDRDEGYESETETWTIPLTVKSAEELEGIEASDICVKATVYVLDETSWTDKYHEVCWSDFRIHVQRENGYYQIAGVAYVENENGEKEAVLAPFAVERRMELGETVTVEPTLWLFDAENSNGKQVDDVRYRWEWDKNAVRIMDANGEVMTPYGDDGEMGYAPFELTRKGDWGTRLVLRAETLFPDEEGEGSHYEEVARYEWHLENLNYDVNFEELRGGDHTWLFEDEEYYLDLNTDNLSEYDNARVVWTVGVANEDGEIEYAIDAEDSEDGVYYELDKDLSGITLYGANLLNNEAVSESDNFVVRAEVYANEEAEEPCCVADAWTYIAANEEYWEDDENTCVVPTQQYRYNNREFRHYVRNKEYPHGRETRMLVLSISSSDTKVLRPYQEDGSWCVDARNYGSAYLAYQLFDTETFEMVTLKREHYVAGEKTYLNVYSSKDTGCIRPGDSLDIITEVWQHKFDEENENRYDEQIDYNAYDVAIEYCDYDVNRIEVNEHGTVFAYEDAEEGETGVNVRVTLTDAEGNETVLEQWMELYVTRGYKQLFAEDLEVDYYVGSISAYDLNVRLTEFWKNGEGALEEREILQKPASADEGEEPEEWENVQLYFRQPDVNWLEFDSEDGSSLRVIPMVVMGEEPRADIDLELVAKYTNSYGAEEEYSTWIHLMVYYEPEVPDMTDAPALEMPTSSDRVTDQQVIWEYSEEKVGDREDWRKISVSENGYYLFRRYGYDNGFGTLFQIYDTNGSICYNPYYKAGRTDTGYLMAGEYYVRLLSHMPEEEHTSLLIGIECLEEVTFGQKIEHKLEGLADSYVLDLPYEGHFMFQAAGLTDADTGIYMNVEAIDGSNMHLDEDMDGYVDGCFAEGPHLVQVAKENENAVNYRLDMMKDLAETEIQLSHEYVVAAGEDTVVPAISVFDRSGYELITEYEVIYYRYDPDSGEWIATEDLESTGYIAVRIAAVEGSDYAGDPGEANQMIYQILEGEYPQITMISGTRSVVAGQSLYSLMNDWTFQIVCQKENMDTPELIAVNSEHGCEHGNAIRVIRVTDKDGNNIIHDERTLDNLPVGTYQIALNCGANMADSVEWNYDVTVEVVENVIDTFETYELPAEGFGAAVDMETSDADETVNGGRTGLYKIGITETSYFNFHRDTDTILQFLNEDGLIIYTSPWNSQEVIGFNGPQDGAEERVLYVRVIGEAETTVNFQVERIPMISVGDTLEGNEIAAGEIGSYVVSIEEDGNYCFVMQTDDGQELELSVTTLDNLTIAAAKNTADMNADISGEFRAGEYWIRVNAQELAAGSSTSYTLEVKKDLWNSEVIVKQTRMSWNGEERIPEIYVEDQWGRLLRRGRDYELLFFRDNFEEPTDDLVSPGVITVWIADTGKASSAYRGFPGEHAQGMYEIICGHVPGEWKTETAPTCTTDGTEVLHCTVDGCGELLERRVDPKKGHTSNNTWKVVKAATLKAAGSKTQNCKVCGAVTKTQSIAKLPSYVILPDETKSGDITSMKIKVGTEYTFKIKMADGDTLSKCASSSTSKLKVVSTAKDGTVKIKALAKGTAKLTFTLGVSGTKRTVTMNVVTTDVAATKFTLPTSDKTVTLEKGKTYTLKPQLAPFTATAITYTTSNAKVATVAAGKITAVAPGTATITIKAAGKSATCKVTVKGIAFTKDAVTIKKSKTTTLVPKIYGGVTGTIKYSSSNTKIAKVDASGKVTALKKAGTVTITAKIGSKYTATYKVTVK